MRTIGVVTASRSDYGICLPILLKVQAEADLKLHLIVSGMHLSADFGLTARIIEGDGFSISDKVVMLMSSDTPEAIGKSMGLGTIGFAQLFAQKRPDILLVVGDRFEMHAAVVAALPFQIPVAHVHGGEVTEGAFDDALRHSITKLSHLHFVSTQEYRTRVLQMGEEDWRVTLSGAPSLDNLQRISLLSRDELAREFGLSLNRPPLLVTYHPVTLEYEQTEWQVSELLRALKTVDLPVVFTLPNADTKNQSVLKLIRDCVSQHQGFSLVENFGTRAYFSMMKCAAAMVGNSSSGIVEAASFELPVVNIGSRQKGRVRSRNVIDVGYQAGEIGSGLNKALDPGFRASLVGLKNPYWNGSASEIIVNKLKAVDLDERLLKKQFMDAKRS